VLAVIIDKKIVYEGSGEVDYYGAEILSSNEYYAFGMQIPSKAFSESSLKYRFGFNGKENDSEVKGEGNQQDYGMRIYDPRVGRFLSLDPLSHKYPELAPYQFASNRPIDGVDLDGLEYVKAIPKYEYQGNAWDIPAAVNNGLIDIVNGLFVDTWNSGVANYQSLKRGTWTHDIKTETKQLAVDLKNNVVTTYRYHANTPLKQQFNDAGNYFTSPQALEDVTVIGINFYTGYKLSGGKENLLKPTTNKNAVTQTTLKQEAASTLSNGEALATKYAKNRPKHRQSTINKTWETAQKNSLDGNVYDPNSGELLTWDKFKKRQGQWDLGHKPKYKYSKELERLRNGELTEEEFLRNYHNPNNYRPEDPSSNRSRKFDLK
jgi:RHS repeat-associated protein